MDGMGDVYGTALEMEEYAEKILISVNRLRREVLARQLGGTGDTPWERMLDRMEDDAPRLAPVTPEQLPGPDDVHFGTWLPIHIRPVAGAAPEAMQAAALRAADLLTSKGIPTPIIGAGADRWTLLVNRPGRGIVFDLRGFLTIALEVLARVLRDELAGAPVEVEAGRLCDPVPLFGTLAGPAGSKRRTAVFNEEDFQLTYYAGWPGPVWKWVHDERERYGIPLPEAEDGGEEDKDDDGDDDGGPDRGPADSPAPAAGGDGACTFSRAELLRQGQQLAKASQGPNAGAAPVQDAEASLFEELVSKFTGLTSREFAAKDYKQSWLVKGIMVAGEPAVLGGASKTLKTTIAAEMGL
jgi:hypothetical protein